MRTKDLQTLFLILGFAFVIIAFIFSLQNDAYRESIDMAYEGGAAGFAILAGICFLCVTIIQIKCKDDLKEKPLSDSKIVYANRLASIAIADYKDNKFVESIKKMRESLSLSPTSAINHYNIACAYAKINEYDKVLFHLEKAVENGYENFEKIKTEIVFEELRNKSSFNEFICNGYKMKIN